jgi:predicted small metal-binding protein
MSRHDRADIKEKAAASICGRNIEKKGDDRMRYYVDCRESLSVPDCSVTMVADTKDEAVEAALNHASLLHGATPSKALMEELENHLHEW